MRVSWYDEVGMESVLEIWMVSGWVEKREIEGQLFRYMERARNLANAVDF